MRQTPDTTVMKPGVLVVLWIAKLCVCVMLGMAAYDKLIEAPSAVEMFEDLGMEPAGRIVVGGLEALVVALILIPQSTAYGALLGLGVMLGAIIGHLTEEALPVRDVPWPLAVALCCVVILWIRRRDAEFIDNLTDR